ncbi:calcium-binding protein, partial [Enterovibrio calviensis]|uniref:calcium-binding protein n=1 Tax=Enterovibrio calviensis TaxID=91359 RepID=UPI000558BD38
PAAEDVLTSLALGSNTANEATADSDYINTIWVQTGNVNAPGNGWVQYTGSLTLPKDGSAINVRVEVKDDIETESNEVVTLTATTTSNQVNGKTDSDTATITDDQVGGPPGVDEEAPNLLVLNGNTVEEADDVYLTYQVKLSGPAAEDVLTKLSLGSDAANEATADSDYINTIWVKLGSDSDVNQGWVKYTDAGITLPKDGSAINVRVEVKDDFAVENDEIVTLKATTTSKQINSKTDSDTATIQDETEKGPEDQVYAVLVPGSTAEEGSGKKLIFTVKLVDHLGNAVIVPSGKEVTVNLKWGAGEATDDDFVSTRPDTIKISGGESEYPIELEIKDDFWHENDDAVVVEIENISQTEDTFELPILEARLENDKPRAGDSTTTGYIADDKDTINTSISFVSKDDEAGGDDESNGSNGQGHDKNNGQGHENHQGEGKGHDKKHDHDDDSAGSFVISLTYPSWDDPDVQLPLTHIDKRYVEVSVTATDLTGSYEIYDAKSETWIALPTTSKIYVAIGSGEHTGELEVRNASGEGSSSGVSITATVVNVWGVKETEAGEELFKLYEDIKPSSADVDVSSGPTFEPINSGVDALYGLDPSGYPGTVGDGHLASGILIDGKIFGRGFVTVEELVHKLSEGNVINSGAGNDHIEAGKGNDTIYLGESAYADKDSDGVFDPYRYDSTDTGQTSVTREFVFSEIGTIHNDNSGTYLEGDGFMNNYTSYSWLDAGSGQEGNDTIHGQAGTDLISGGSGTDILYGGTEDDFIRGGIGDDKIFGGTGDDYLRGEKGDDDLTGGEGNDVFVFSVSDTEATFNLKNEIVDENYKDTITDFNTSEDKIHLSDLVSSESSIESMISVTEGDDGTLILNLDIDGDGDIEQHIVLNNIDFEGSNTLVINTLYTQGGSDVSGTLTLTKSSDIGPAPQITVDFEETN